MKALLYVAAAILAGHGLIHLMGFVAYWPVAPVAELPYKTVLAGRWDVGAAGMKVFALLWLISALAFVVSIYGLVSSRAWWPTAMLGTIVISTVVILLDWAPAFRGAIINGVILVGMIVTYFVRGGLTVRPF